MNHSFAQHYLEDARSAFRAYKKMADKALTQLKDEEYFVTLDAESNSIAVIMKHMAGNMLSRWTDFLTTDGEKPDRYRDLEFVTEPQTTKDDVLAYWDNGWACVFGALEPLTAADFDRQVMIRGEAHTIVQAINRQLMHYASHIGQIVFLAKHFRSSEWKSLSIPRNRSAEVKAYHAGNASPADKDNQLKTFTSFGRESETHTKE
jgi:hypothetical protein